MAQDVFEDEDQAHLYDYDIESYCIVCDQRIDPNRPVPPTTTSNFAPSPPPLAPPPSASTSSTSHPPPPAPPNPTPSSSKSHAAPPLRRTGSNHSTHSNKSTTSAGSGTTGIGGLKRNRSTGKLSAGGRRNHSHSNLHALAPMTSQAKGKKVAIHGVGPAATDKSTTKNAEREREKALRAKEKEREKEQLAVTTPPPSTLYCSEECRKIDEARNQLTLTSLGHLSSTTLSTSSASPGPSDGFEDVEDHRTGGSGPPHSMLGRRRSSGLSSGASTSYTTVSSSRGLSPIIASAAPTSNPSHHIDSSGFPFPNVSTSSSSPVSNRRGPSPYHGSPSFSRTASNFSLPPPVPSHSASSASTLLPSRTSSSSLLSLTPSHQSDSTGPLSAPGMTLNFSSRRQSRSSHSSGAYSYRPSLMERAISTDSAIDSKGGGNPYYLSTSSDRNPALTARVARSLSITSGDGTGGGWFGRVRSVDGLVGMLGGRQPVPGSESGSDREATGATRSAFSHQPPSALSSLRPMTPMNGLPSSRSSSRPAMGHNQRHQSEPTTTKHVGSLPPSALNNNGHHAHRQRRRSSHSRRPHHGNDAVIAGSDPPPPPIIGSLPVSLGVPTLPPRVSSTSSSSRLGDAATSPIDTFKLAQNRRSSSSASLNLLASRSYDGSGFRGRQGRESQKGFATTTTTGSTASANGRNEGSLNPGGAAGFRRSDSKAELSGLVAVGEMSNTRSNLNIADNYERQDRDRRTSFGGSQDRSRTALSAHSKSSTTVDPHSSDQRNTSFSSHLANGRSPPPASSTSTKEDSSSTSKSTNSASSSKPPHTNDTTSNSEDVLPLNGGRKGEGSARRGAETLQERETRMNERRRNGGGVRFVIGEEDT